MQIDCPEYLINRSLLSSVMLVYYYGIGFTINVNLRYFNLPIIPVVRVE